MLTLEFMPYDEIAQLSSNKRISKLLRIVKENKILLLEGRLKKEEEAELIKRTMEEIDEDFKGIELGVIFPGEKESDMLKKLKANMVNLLLGDRRGFTIIGPATVVKEIKQDPNKIQLFTNSKFKS
ncbi:DUF2073 domain-containing protein [Candidatus Woesearchaeota archaeon]|jgi:hypothetical protein|nr:DUF2073 domain-containing protein [Candidatus Woesearchaeota archaeon]MBT5273069.1 DUF2073 domain-containing protein [Candidatus Woesearchaeota archaeon]MBT6041008.1 DUF2073 domain-containing protein [Candidatus Woesearchaeota archaeon]MBT6337616.1 DUF2073 domain-containing protein [Candidatus Woesearchaeota archaeon]MBT7926983.1 DUF2073 domain-containing protein [Candidatus Woesearchaeota archaeon]